MMTCFLDIVVLAFLIALLGSRALRRTMSKNGRLFVTGAVILAAHVLDAILIAATHNAPGGIYYDTEGYFVVVPLYLALPASLPFFIAAVVLRKPRRTLGICVKCEYDLTGNVSGVCPECGTAVDGNVDADSAEHVK